MANKFNKPVLNLKQFMLKQEVKTLYRRMLKTIRTIPNPSHQQELTDWVRSDFRNNANLTDEIAIKMMIKYGEKCLRELETSLSLAK